MMLRSHLAAAIALAVLAVPGVPAAAQTAELAATGEFTPIGDFAEYRFDGLREGQHEGAPVYFLDMTLRNRSETTTFPGTIQEVRWQGRSTGREVPALRRDLTRFGMYDFVEPSETVGVTYIIPARADIEGVTIEYPKAGDGPRKRTWTWEQLRGGDLAAPSAAAGESPASSPESYLGNGFAQVREQASGALSELPALLQLPAVPALPPEAATPAGGKLGKSVLGGLGGLLGRR